MSDKKQTCRNSGKTESGLAHSRLNLLSKLQRCNSVSEERQKKRKVMDTSLEGEKVDPYKRKESAEAFTLREAMESIVKLSEELENNIKETYNPPNRLKEIALKIKRGTNVFTRESIVGWLETLKWEPIEKVTYDADTQISPTSARTFEANVKEDGEAEQWILKRKVQEMEAQIKKQNEEILHLKAENERIKIELEKADRREGRGLLKSRVTKEEILTVENREHFDLIKDKIWEDKIFENVEIVVGNPLSESMSECMMVIV